MHELGLVVYVIDAIEELAKENNLTHVASVTLEVGEVSAIVPEFITDCWEVSRTKSELLKETEIRMEMLPAVTICNTCEKTYSTLEFAKICPHCGSSDTQLLRGNEFNIKEIEAC